MKTTKRQRKASIVASRMTGPDDDDEFRLYLQFEDKEAPHFIEVRMTGQQFAEMLTARVTEVVATETTRHA